jgi:alkylhydroperoxidase family enzyme
LPRITIPDGPEPITDRVYSLRPEFAEPAAKMYEAVNSKSILPERIKEAMRYRIAQINGCLLCQASRSSAAAQDGFTEEVYATIADFASSPYLSDREKLAVRYAELFALDHHRLDDAMFEDLHREFSDAEILDLTFFTARYMAFGRLTHVLGLDDACVVPTATGARSAMIPF